MQLADLYQKASNFDFLSADEGVFLFENAPTAELMNIADNEAYSFAEVEHLGSVTLDSTTIDLHIEKILALDFLKP